MSAQTIATGTTSHAETPLLGVEGLSLEAAGFRPLAPEQLGMFKPKGEMQKGRLALSRELNIPMERFTDFAVDASVGSPVIPGKLHHRLQAHAILKHDVSDTTSLPDSSYLVSALDDQVGKKVIPNAAKYSLAGGGPDHKKRVRDELDLNGSVAADNITLVSGGTDGALELVDRFFINSSSDTGLETKTIVVTNSADELVWDDIVADLSDASSVFNLVVHDTSKLPEGVKTWLKKRLSEGGVMVTDVLNKPLSKDSLGFDKEVGGVVISVEASGNDATGIAAVVANPNTAKIIESYQLGWRGTPPSSQLDVRQFMSEIGIDALADYQNISPAELAGLEATSPALYNAIYFLQLTNKYKQAKLAGDKTAADSIHAEITGAHETLATQLEDRFKAVYAEKMPVFADGDIDVAVADGAARGGLNAISRLSGIKAYLTPKPNWPTEMTVGDDVQKIDLDNCFDDDGRLNVDTYLTKIQQYVDDFAQRGEKVGLDMKLIGNPQGMRDDPETIKKVIEFAKKHSNVVIIEDIMYLTYPGKDASGKQIQVGTYLKEAQEQGIADRVYGSFSASKDMWLAGVRTDFVVSGDKTFINAVREDRQTRTPNWMSTIMVNERLANKAEYWKHADFVNADTQHRLALAHAMFDEAGIPHKMPEVGYYIPYLELQRLTDSANPEKTVNDMAAKYQIALNAMESFMGTINGSAKSKEKGARLSLGGQKVTARPGASLEDILGDKPYDITHVIDYQPLAREIAKIILADMHYINRGQMRHVKDTTRFKQYVKEGIITPEDIEMMDALWDRAYVEMHPEAA